MTSLKLVILIATIACIANARTVLNDPGPPSFGYSTSQPPDLNLGEVMMKDAILYLTPSQIKAYEASQGQNQGVKLQVSDQDIQNVEAEIKRQLAQQNIYSINSNNNEKPVLNFPNVPKPVVEEPVDENPFKYIPKQEQKWSPFPIQQEEQKFINPAQNENYNYNHKPAESYSFIKIFTDHEVHETPKLQLFHPLPHDQNVHPELEKFLEVHRDPVHNKQYKLIPYDYKALQVPRLDYLKEITRLTSLLENYQKQNTEEHGQLTVIPKVEEDKLEKLQKGLPDFKFVPQFEEQKHNDESQKFLINIEKDNALARAEAILSTHPAVVRKDVNTKRRPGSSIKSPSSQQGGKDWFRKYIPLDSIKDSSHVWKH